MGENIVDNINEISKNLSILFNETNSIIRDFEISSKMLQNTVSSKWKTCSDLISEISIKDLPKLTPITNNMLKFWDKIAELTGGLQFADILTQFTKNSKIIAKNIKKIGIQIIKSNPTKAIGNYRTVKTMNNEDWMRVSSEFIKDDSIHEVGTNLSKFIKDYYEEIFSSEVNKASKLYGELSQEVITAYKSKFSEERLNFEDFFEQYQESLKESIKPIKHKIQTDIEAEEENSTAQFDGYEAYFNADKRTLERMKRNGKYDVKGKKTTRRVRRPKKSNKSKR